MTFWKAFWNKIKYLKHNCKKYYKWEKYTVWPVWTFRGWNFSRFWRKNEVPSGQWDRERVWSDTQKWCKNCYFWWATLFLKLKWIKIFIFIHYNFFCLQNWSKSNRFFTHHYNGYNKLSIVNFRLPKVSTLSRRP